MQSRKGLCFFVPWLMVSLLMAATSAYGGTWYVDVNTCPAAGDGSAANPFCSIQAGIDAATAGDEVLVAPGTYAEAINFSGKGIVVQGVSGADVTTIDATGLSASVVTCNSGEPVGTLLDGFSLTGGDTSFGGGVRVANCRLTVRRCLIENNAANVGAGVHTVSGGELTVEDSTIRGNHAGAMGANVYAAAPGASITLRNVLVTDNGATTSVHATSGASLVVEGGTFQDGSGEVLKTDNATASISDTLFEGTQGTALSATNSSTVDVARSVFRRNNGLAIEMRNSSGVVDNSVFVANTSTGPVILNFRGELTLVNCALVANTFDTEYFRAPAALIDTEVSLSGLRSHVYNSIIWGNKPHDYIPGVATQAVEIKYTIGDGRIVDEGVFEDDPRFVRMPDPGLNGWDGVDDDYGDLHLTSESPGIDVGNDALRPAGASRDLDDNLRVQVAPCTTGAAVDLGPYEFMSPVSCGDGVCAGGETCANCSCDCGTCCGNGVCGINETCANCKVDCACPSPLVPGNYPTIQAAIDNTAPGDVVTVAPGTYHESIAFGGRRITVRGTGGPDVTIIDATGLSESGVRFDGAENHDSVLDGFTITGGVGHTMANGSGPFGGGIFSIGAVPTITNCLVEDNTADLGGGMCGDATTLSNCAFRRNTADVGGAVGEMTGATVAISDCVFEDNSAASGGGAISASDLAATVSNCEFARHVVYWDGGAIAASGLSGEITGCTFVDNSGRRGGAIHIDSPTTAVEGSIRQCQFSGNTATELGGAIHSRASIELIESVFEDNAAASGGGAYLWSSTVERSQFRRNAASVDGGGLYVLDSDNVVSESLFTENAAVRDGGGLVLEEGTVVNSRFEHNTAATGGGATLGGQATTYSSGATISASSIFANSADSGGGIAFVSTKNAVLVNSVVVGNSATIGGGVFAQKYFNLIYPTDIHSAVVNSTLVANEAPTGAGIGVDSRDSSGQASAIEVHVFNSIFLNRGGDEVWLDTPSDLTIAYTNVAGSYPGVGNIDAEPIFLRMPDDGGDGFGDDPVTPNVDESANDDYGDLRLETGSPCIDAGSNSAVPPDVSVDLEGKPRFLEDQSVPDTGEGVAPVVDMGAFEYRPVVPLGDTVLASRYFSVASQGGGAETAIGVTLVDLAGYPAENGRTLWLGPTQQEPEEDSSEPGRTFTAARLQCTPHFADWSSVGLVYVYGGEIVPGSEYELTEFLAAAGGSPGAAVGTPITVRTGVWGDVAPLYAGLGVPTQPDFNDLSALVAKFLADPEAPIKALAQLQPNIPLPMVAVDFRDISAAVTAFVGAAYVDLGGITGPCTCPSAVTCGATACAGDLECSGGYCIDGFCTDACGRCTP